MSVTNKKAKLLDDGWQWKIYDDGSGHLESTDGKSYFSFDYAIHFFLTIVKKHKNHKSSSFLRHQHRLRKEYNNY